MKTGASRSKMVARWPLVPTSGTEKARILLIVKPDPQSEHFFRAMPPLYPIPNLAAQTAYAGPPPL
jgi:hypothetical protein